MAAAAAPHRASVWSPHTLSSSSSSPSSSPLVFVTLVLVLSLCGLPLPVRAALPMTRQSLSYAFQNRSEVYLQLMASPVQYYPTSTSTVATASSAHPLVMWGGHLWWDDNGVVGGNDSYVLDTSTQPSSLVSVSILSGTDYYGRYMANDSTGQYYYQGAAADAANPALTAGTVPMPSSTGCGSASVLYLFAGHVSPPVHHYSLDGGLHWTDSQTAVEDWVARTDPVCVVDPATGGLYVMAGLGYTPFIQLNDVWHNPGGASIDVEAQWSLVTPAAAWPARDQASAAAATNPYLNRTVMYIAAGHTQNYQYGQSVNGSGYWVDGSNDVWASSNLGVSWSAVTLSAPWGNRTGARLAISAAGTMVIAEGSVTGHWAGDFYPHDIWASVDGGFSWGQCAGMADATWAPRRLHGLAFDASGRLWMAAGECWGTSQAGAPPNAGNWWTYDVNNGNKYDDVQVSTISFDDPAQVAQHCGVQASPCGIGARCWPIQGNANCPCTASSSSSSASTPSPSSASTSASSLSSLPLSSTRSLSASSSTVSSSAAPLPPLPSSSASPAGASSSMSAALSSRASTSVAASSSLSPSSTTAGTLSSSLPVRLSSSDSSPNAFPSSPSSGPSSSTGLSGVVSPDGGGGSSSGSTLPVGAIVGIVVGVVLACCCLLLAFALVRRRKRHAQEPGTPVSEGAAASTDSDSASPSRTRNRLTGLAAAAAGGGRAAVGGAGSHYQWGTDELELHRNASAASDPSARLSESANSSSQFNTSSSLSSSDQVGSSIVYVH